MNLFDKYGKYTQEGFLLDKKIRNLLEPIIKDYIDRGYDVRAIGHVMVLAVSAAESTVILRDLARKERRERGTFATIVKG